MEMSGDQRISFFSVIDGKSGKFIPDMIIKDMSWETGFNTLYEIECDLDTFIFLNALQGTISPDNAWIEARYIHHGLPDNPHEGHPLFAFDIIEFREWKVIGQGERQDGLTFNLKFRATTIFSETAPDWVDGKRTLDVLWALQAGGDD
jgi:hypothetical protein